MSRSEKFELPESAIDGTAERISRLIDDSKHGDKLSQGAGSGLALKPAAIRYGSRRTLKKLETFKSQVDFCTIQIY